MACCSYTGCPTAIIYFLPVEKNIVSIATYRRLLDSLERAIVTFFFFIIIQYVSRRRVFFRAFTH